MIMKEMPYKKVLLQALKISIGSSVAIYIATFINLQFAASAGTIALLTIVTTKWETIKLSFFRLISFFISVFLAGILFQTIKTEWVAFGSYIFLLVLICELLQWKAVLSVNTLIGIHFLTEQDFSYKFIKNEFWLVAIGIIVAIILNLFHDNKSQKRKIIQNMRYTEENLQIILGELAAYLDKKNMQRDVWEDIRSLEEKLHQFVGSAYEYQGNTFHSHPGYYIDYFEMRTKQCNVLHNLHYEMKKIRKIPKQAKVISEYILYMRNYVIEVNEPIEQIDKLNLIFEKMKYEPLPISREEFESRAMLYHILMDLEDYLIFKKRFVESLSKQQKERYWGKN